VGKIMQYSEDTPAPVITIDGPSASGKGTVAQRVARVFGFHYLDSGALYRLTALSSARHHIALEQVNALAEVAANLSIEFVGGKVLLEGHDVSEEIRSEPIGNRASALAVYGPVRAALVARQRAFRHEPGLVADGRDMGTVIFPDATLKVFLTASVETRAQRRHKQLIKKGFSANIHSLLKDLRERDVRDSSRATAPLKPAQDAIVLDTSALSVDEATATVIGWFEALTRSHGAHPET
jgi:cytidylate kinase